MARAAEGRRTVVVTGAAGYIAAQLLPALRERYELRLVDVRRDDRQGQPVEGVVVHNLHAPDLEAHRPLFRGAYAAVHLAYHRPRDRRDRGYLDERENLDLAYHVLQLALEEGLDRVVVASSNHAADWYERLVHAGQKDMVYPDERPLSYGWYGWAKATYEHMGFLYAQGAVTGAGGSMVADGAPGIALPRQAGRKLGVVLVRIGAPRDLALTEYTGRVAAFKRDLGAYVSPRDLAQLFCKSLEAPNLEDEHGVPFQIFYGISDNTRAFWSIANTRRVIGYAPQDDSELKYAALIDRLLSEAPGRVGG